MKKILIYLFAFSFFVNSSYAGITFWTTEVQPERMEKQKTMAKAFEAKTGISVEVIPVEEKDLGTRATARPCRRKSSRCDLSHFAICFTLG